MKAQSPETGVGDDYLPTKNRNTLCSIAIEHDEGSVTDVLRRELESIIADLQRESSFELVGRDLGPYDLLLSTRGARMAFIVSTIDRRTIVSHVLSLAPFRRIIRDYVLVCTAHYAATADSNRHRLQAIDMARRGIHNSAAELLRERLSGKIKISLETARALFSILALPKTAAQIIAS